MITEYIWAVVFGAVQGLTEFLPISSSGHLVILHSIADFSFGDALAFDVALHVGTLVAVVWYFRQDISRLFRGWIRTFQGTVDASGKLAWYILMATVPAAILGYLLESTFEEKFRRPELVGIVLALGGIALWAADRWSTSRRSIEQGGWVSALSIGFGQALALIPGVSRSGATIMVARLFGFTRDAAARFSFLLSIPIIAGAGLKKALDVQAATIDWGPFAVGMIASGIVGYWAIGFLLRLVQRRTYTGFAIYRLIIGALVFALWYGR